MTIERLQTNARMSMVVKNAGVAYLAGQVANDPKADLATQTQQVFDKIDALLASAGSDKSKILSATIYLPDMDDFAALNAAWEAWIPAGQCPARATVQAKLAAVDYKVEIQVIAAK